MLQPVGVLAVIGLGLAGLGRYPGGTSGERWLLAGVVLATVPGLAGVVVDAVRSSRRGEARPFDMAVLRQLYLDTALREVLAALWVEVPILRRHTSADVVDRLVRWGLLQLGLSLVTLVLLLALPIDENWAFLALLALPVVAVVWVLALAGGLIWLALALVVAGTRGARAGVGSGTVAARALVICLGVALLGLVVVVPAALAEGFGDSGAAWGVARRVAMTMVVVGIGGGAAAFVVSARSAHARATQGASTSGQPEHDGGGDADDDDEHA